MLLRVFKSNQAYNFLLVPIVALAIWMVSFLRPELTVAIEEKDAMLLYLPFLKLANLSPLGSKILALVLLLVLSFQSLKLNVDFAFIRVRNFMSSSLMVLIASGLNEMHVLHPVYLAAICLFLVIYNVFRGLQRSSALSNEFNAGFMTGLAGLFYAPAFFFFPFVWIGIIVVRKSPQWRDFFLALIGLAVPVILASGYLFVFDKLYLFTEPLQSLWVHNKKLISGDFPVQIYLGVLIVLTLIGTFFMVARNYDEKKVSSRKYFKLFFWLFVNALAVLVLIPSVSHEIFIILAIPLSYLIANYFVFMKRTLWGEGLFLVLISIIIYLQFT
ncbi:hypothetical protein EYV94_11570 [Puteibacter caeruleilacunae]|nr:hypothetical protein EYV94_11570 [Puteibacter caeruleilacunae]